jgi:segregation and condensation protein A
MLDTSIQVKTDHFDGPLALLLLLVQKEEMDVRELDLTKITQQYLSYLAGMRELNFDVAGDYLYLAATLLFLKSKNCVTEEEMGRLQDGLDGSGDLNITSQSELVRRLEELQHFQKMGEVLWGLPKKGYEIFCKPKVNRRAIINSILTPIELDMLTGAMIELMQKERKKYTIIKRDRLSIKEKLNFLKKHLKIGNKTDFETLLDHDGERSIDNIVITFISLLELARLHRIEISQNEAMSNIFVNVTKDLEDFNPEQANGFEEEEEESLQVGEEIDAEALKEMATAAFEKAEAQLPDLPEIAELKIENDNIDNENIILQ